MSGININLKAIEEALSSYDARLVYLVASGLKPAGEIEIDPFPEDIDRICSLLERVGLQSYLHKGKNRMSVPSFRLVDTTERLTNCGLDYEVLECEKGEYSIVVPNSMKQILFWNSDQTVDPEKIAIAYEKGDHITFGQWAGYPLCCCREYKPIISLNRFDEQLQLAFQDGGFEAINHLVGIFHIPHNISCKETRKMGYSSHLIKNAPNLYNSAKIALLDLAQGKCKFI